MNIHKFFLCHILIYATSLRPITSSCLFNGSYTLDTECTDVVVNSFHSSVNYSFIDLDELNSLTIERNKVNAPPNLPWKMKTNLRRLTFQYCGLNSLRKNYFSGFRKLISLSILTCELTDAPSLPNFLKAQLAHFDISGNNISNIPPNYFTKFSKLTELNLKSNEFLKFSFGNSIKHLLQLQLLHLDQMKCDCTEIEMWMDVRSRLTSLTVTTYDEDLNDLGSFPCSKPLEKISLQQLNENICITMCSNDASACVHGICIKNSTKASKQYECSCHKGWIGRRCKEDVNECTEITDGVQMHECSSQSICRNLDGGYTCDCDYGWTGKFCNVEPNFKCYVCVSRNYDCDLKMLGSFISGGMIQERSCPDKLCSTVYESGRTYFRCGDISFCKTPNVSCCVKPLCNAPVIREQRSSSSSAYAFLCRYDILLLIYFNLQRYQ